MRRALTAVLRQLYRVDLCLRGMFEGSSKDAYSREALNVGFPRPICEIMLYASSKSALNAVTILQAKESKSKHPQIRVDAASPGFLKTALNG